MNIYLIVSVGQEFKCGLPGCLWLKVFHVVQHPFGVLAKTVISLGGSTGRGPISKLPQHGLLIGFSSSWAVEVMT